SMISPRRFENDPFNQIENLRGTDVYISAGSGIPSPSDANYPWNLALSGAALEAVALGSTRIWDTKARALGVNFTANYPATGIHNWNQFGSQLSKTRNAVWMSWTLGNTFVLAQLPPRPLVSCLKQETGARWFSLWCGVSPSRKSEVQLKLKHTTDSYLL